MFVILMRHYIINSILGIALKNYVIIFANAMFSFLIFLHFFVIVPAEYRSVAYRYQMDKGTAGSFDARADGRTNVIEKNAENSPPMHCGICASFTLSICDK